MSDRDNIPNYAEIVRMVEADLDHKVAVHKEFQLREAEIFQIMDIALNALQDHSPALSATLMKKAKALFQAKPSP